jgi:hypothetical protein
MDEPRSRTRRRRDTEHRLEHGVDLWLASASPAGEPFSCVPATGSRNATA